MLRYIKHINIISTLNRVVSAGSISIFFDVSSRPIFLLKGRFYIDNDTGNGEFSYGRSQIDQKSNRTGI